VTNTLETLMRAGDEPERLAAAETARLRAALDVASAPGKGSGFA